MASKKILIVDDEEDVLRGLQHMLQRVQYQVVTTASGSETLHLAKHHRPDLIILDFYLPDMRGDEIKQALSEDEETQNIPTIFLTGMISKDDELFLRSIHEHVHVLSKPVDREDLLRVIADIIP